MSRKNDIPGSYRPPAGEPLASFHGRDVSEDLAELAAHRRPKDLPGPLIGIGALLFVGAVLGLAATVGRTFYAQTNYVLLAAIGVLGLLFMCVGIAFKLTLRRPQYRPGANQEANHLAESKRGYHR